MLHHDFARRQHLAEVCAETQQGKEKYRPLKKVVVISDLSEERDGPTAVAIAGVRQLRSLGVDVTYFCGDAGVNPELQSLGVRIVASDKQEIGTMRKSQAFLRGLSNLKSLNKLTTLINENDDMNTVYHLHNWTKILTPTVFLALTNISDRLVITAHDYFMACPNGGYFDFKRKELCERVPLSVSCLHCNCVRGSRIEKAWRSVRHLEKNLFARSVKGSTVVAVHHAMVPLLIKGGVSEESIAVIKNPVLPWSNSRVAVEHNSMFLFVGRLEHDKGPHLLALAARSAGVKVIFVGDGPLRSGLEKAFPEFAILGWKTRAQISEIAAHVRAVVMPTGSRETFGLVAFEALTSGIPVIVSTFSSTATEIEARGVGFVCNPYNEQAFSSLLIELARDGKLCEEMSHRAWSQRDQIAPSVSTWGRQLTDLYISKLTNRSNG